MNFFRFLFNRLGCLVHNSTARIIPTFISLPAAQNMRYFIYIKKKIFPFKDFDDTDVDIGDGIDDNLGVNTRRGKLLCHPHNNDDTDGAIMFVAMMMTMVMLVMLVVMVTMVSMMNWWLLR